MNKTVKHLLLAVGLLVASVAISALIAYASSMAILMLGLHEYGECIMCGIFILSTLIIFASNYRWLEKASEKKYEEPEVKERDYFKDGDFSRKY